MKKNKALTAINRLRLDDYIREMFHTFGISVNDCSSYCGFVRKDSRFEIWFPVLQDHAIVNFLHKNCRMYMVTTFTDVKRVINAEQRKDPEYFEDLERNMKGVINT